MASSQFPVAIIGMATRLPGAQTCEEFWGLLKNGGDSVAKFPHERIPDIEHAIAPFRGQLVDEDEPFFTGSFFRSVDTFDAKLFQINPKEALFIEPEQRFFLETTWEAIEDAGYASTIRGSNTGVYVGNTVNKYKYILTENHPSMSHGNHSPFISSRVSYTHNLQGPAMMIATGSLLAVHVACQGLLSGDCDMAIAGGITLDLLPVSAKTDIWNEFGITSSNVKCRAFDASANGNAKGEGCGVVILKPLAKAEIDGDHIYGVLEATTANQDGHSNEITAPNPGSQANMLCRAWELADITPDRLSYFETHGTGTELEDPIEISGITKAFKKFDLSYRENDAESKIPIGSVKANIGNLADGAAGVVSLIKVLMCLRKEKIPPAINFTKPNPHINWDSSPVYVNTNLKEWPSSQDISTRYASVSAFGLLRTNVHAVVHEYKAEYSSKCVYAREEDCQESQLLTLAANTGQSLVTLVGKLATFFRESETKSYMMLRNVCYTLNTGREQKRFKYRAIAFGTTWQLMSKALDELHQDLNSATPARETGTPKDCAYSVNFGNRSLYNVKLPSDIHKNAKLFLNKEDTCWNKFYTEKSGYKKVPLLPNYAFEPTRFWPEVGKAMNSKLLELECGLAEQSQIVCDSFENSFSLKPSKECKLNTPQEKLDCSSVSNVGVKKFIYSALNEVLSTDYDWEEMADENLFALGMDFLLCTKLSMKLRDTVNYSVTLAEFHDNPTCAGLINLVNKHMNAQTGPDESTKKSREDKHTISEVDVKLILGTALNNSLATNYDWQERENENLFTLGFDSLTCTQVNMELADALNLPEPLTMVELRRFPTYSSLSKVICKKLRAKSPIRQIYRDNQPTESHSDEQTMFPLAFGQKQLWVMEEMGVSLCATNCLRIEGNFHPEAFIAATNTALSRHSAFFTIITDTKEGPKQTHQWNLNVKVEEIDMKQFGSQAEEATMSFYSDDYKTHFDLRAGPPVRCRLYRAPNDVFYFTMVVHNIVFDGWSHFVFYNELWDTYKKLCDGKKVEEDLQHPLYTEFAKEEQHRSAPSKMETHMTYWKEKLDGPLPLTTFPGDKRRPAVFTYQGKRITRFLGYGTLETIKNFSCEKYTVFVKLLSVVYALLHKYTGDKDLIIGTPVAGRNDLRFKHVIGCFVNTLVLRVQLPNNCTFVDILDEVSAVFLEAFDHQMTPFDHIVSQLNLPPDTSITPVVSVNVCYHNTEIKAEHTSPPSEITVERKLQHNETTKWDMQFDFLHEPEGMRFTLEYYSDFFSDEYAETIVDNFICLMKSCCQNRNTRLKNLGTMRETDQKKNLDALSVLRGPVRPNVKSLAMLLMESFHAHAESTAVIEDSELQITYKELLEHAIECSWFLREVCRLPKQSRIGLLLQNSTEAIEYILATVFSGLVYVPMDPASPKPRLEHVCQEAEIKVIVFGRLHIGMANHLHWACPSVQSIICVDSQEFHAIQDVVENSPLMNVELWNCVANMAKDVIEGGGWKSSYTGEYMSVDEMEEYAENVFIKLKDYLQSTTRVLEIGCASGPTVQKLCRKVGYYVATDHSETMTTRLRTELSRKGVTNVEVLCVSADQVKRTLQGRKFDLIVMNSVVHCFPGHNYMRAVFKDCEKLLEKDGVIFLGDIMDLELKEKLVMSLKSFKKAHPECKVKTDWRNELFLSRAFMQHLCDSSNVLSVITSRKYYTVANELTKFRFDALFTTKSVCQPSCKQAVEKQVFALQDVTEALKTKESDALHQIVCDWSRNVHFQDEAYVLYTSGTTGTPKGVIIGHEALVNYVTWATKAYQFDLNTFTPFFAPLTFDFTITSIFPPLLGGSIIRIFQPFQDSYQIQATSTEITTAKYSPLQLDTILSYSTQPLSTSIFILGGEELTSSLLQKLKINKGDCQFVVWNEYGPTEATVGCVVRCLTSDELPLKEYEHIPIGKPIDNVTVAVVRNQQDLVPQGAKGHLAIGGKCLCMDFAGSGVSRDTKRTKSFKPSCWGRPGEQMLLTEDIVEFMPMSGELVCFGRDRDSEMTKVNGIRVDLMEVQQMVEAHPLVASAWVCTFTHNKHMFLGAAVKLENGTQNMTSGDVSWKQQLVPSLAEVLPIRSIPKIFVQLSTAPINKNGKKDVDYLQKLFLAEIISGSGNASKSTAIFERTAMLQRIWQSILPIDHLPEPEDDFFFDLSGDSFQAIHLVRKMRDEGFSVSITDIFQNPSIQKLTPILQKREGKRDCAKVSSETEENPFRPTPIIEKYVKRCSSLKQPDRFSLSAMLEFHEEILPGILEKALKSLIRKHGSLRSRFGVKDGQVFQQVVPVEANELKVRILEIEKTKDHLADEPMFIELCDKLEQSHSLTDGHLVSAAVINVNEKNASEKREHFALLVVHHIALDIVSWQQLLEDLASAFRKLSEDDTEEPELTKCHLTFQTYCKALQTEAESVFIKEVDYWMGIEEECKKSGRLIEGEKQSSFRLAEWVSEAIDATLLRSTSKKLECSEENMLLTAFGRALSAIHGHDKTSICLESHGRQLKTVDSTDTVGWCTSRFPVVLYTPLSGDLISQVKEMGQKMSMIPNHGLGFGLLKSKGQLRMPIPNIMFVYQGSMDASTKKKFEGGCFSFNHIPWIEVMLNELKEGRFHRHPEELLEYDLEIIAWIHGGELKFGCLFDSSVVNKEVIRGLMKQAQLNVLAMAEQAKTKPKEISVEIIPGFNITPECLKYMTDALTHHVIVPKQVQVRSPEQILQVLCTPDTDLARVQSPADVTLLIPRPRNTAQAEEFINVCGQSSIIVKSKSVVIVNTEYLPNTSKLPTPLLTDQVSVEVRPEYLASFYDNHSDTEYNMPLTRAGYWNLGVTLARAVRACTWGSKYKVIAVDADYTLWDGECAEGSVRFNHGNYELHKFLLNKKVEGMLLVILSKNSQADVECVFEQQNNEMKLKKDDFTVIIADWKPKPKNIRHVSNLLNLGIDSFVFIDDNPVECEKMVQCCPEVLTLQLPSLPELVAPLLQNLWALDCVEVSSEASKRTEMYRSELARQADLQGVETDTEEDKIRLNELLLNWEIKLDICKTSIGSLRSVRKLYARTKELLQRTNQFKMNDLNCNLADSNNNDTVWLVSLKDKHGAYGIVSVILLNKIPDAIMVTQWVLSCRALGRCVEGRILKEIHTEAATFGKKTDVKLVINKTGRNIPALDFLGRVSIDTSAVFESQLNIVCSNSSAIKPSLLPLHNVHEVSDLNLFFKDSFKILDVTHQESDMESKQNSNHITAANKTSTHTAEFHESFGKSTSLNETCNSSTSLTALTMLNGWIEKSWSQAQKYQVIRHKTFPIITYPSSAMVTATNSQEIHTSEKETALRLSWMEVLQADKEPNDSDTFVQSGGNSFSAVYLVSMLRQLCAIEISIVDVLQNRTYAEIKNIIKEACPLNEESISIPQTEYERQMPLSAAQQRMVLMQETSFGSAAYVETLAFRTCLEINPKEIISALVQKHPILKSKITLNDKTLEYSRSIENEIKIDVMPELVESPNVSEVFLKRTTPVIVVVDSILFKARLITAKEESVLALHVHRVIVDDVTLANIASDFEEMINRGVPAKSKSILADDYANYVKQETLYLISRKCKDDEKFWKKKFETLPPESNLAIRSIADSTSFETKVYPAKHFIRGLSVEAVDRIGAYCRKRGLTEFQYFLSCATLVVQRYLGAEEVTLAIPVTTRMEKHEKTDGLYVNTVLSRISVNQAFTIKEHIQTVSTQWLQTLRHSNYPLDQVTKTLWKTHRKNSSSFCSVMFNYAVHSSRTGELNVLARDAKMPLSLDVVKNQQSNETVIVAEWADQLIEDGIVQRLVESVVQLCTTACKYDEKSVYEFQVLSNKEHSLLKSFTTAPINSTTEETRPVHSSFEDFVRKTPHATAVAIDGQRLSYRQLDELSSKIADALLAEVKEETLKNSPIVIVANKDEYTIAAILGVWKAGGHFLPVATTNQSSLKNILARNQPAVILTNLSADSLLLNKEDIQSCTLLMIEELTKRLSHKPNVARANVTSEDLAYIIQTSGSTGVPKQCKISHRSLRIIANAWKDRYAMTEFKVNVLQWAPLSFDVFVGDVVRALICAQGQLTICPDERRLDIPYILQLIENYHITIAEVTPLFGQQLVENAHHDQFTSVKVFILGSDVLQRHVYQSIKDKLRRDQRVLNSYGMTEATIDSAFFEGDILPTTRSDTVPIGKPLPGVSLHVLEPRTLLPCPVGTIGELYISGNVLASGDVDLLPVSHLRCPALKTGDAACCLPSGDIELMGRMDNMVKLRGFRISTTEIENKIVETIHNVTQACVIPWREEHDTGIEFLIAFLVTNQLDGREITIDRKFVCSKLKGGLPYYMLPDIVHIIPEIPLSTNGKVNYKALPEVSKLLKSRGTSKLQTSSIKSSTTTTLKMLFAEALGLPDSSQIDPELTFMEQGAHSLILVKFSTLITQKTSFGVTTADIFSYPTISALEEFIMQEAQNYNDVNTRFLDVKTILPSSIDNVEDIAITGIQESTLRVNVGELLGTKLNETRELIKTLPVAPAADLQETLGSFCSAIIIKLFLNTSLNEYLVNDNEITLNDAFSLSEMMPKYEKFFFVMVRELWQNELLEATGMNKTVHCLESFVFKCKHLLDVDPKIIAENAIKRYPSWADCFRFPLYCSQYLEKVVRGIMSPLSVIYPQGDLNFMFQFDKLGDLLGDVYYNMYMQLIASYAKQLSGQGKYVRILEVGAGVGHVTRQILPKLKDATNIEYWFTDLGKVFVDHAKTTFSDYIHMMKFSTFDITKSAPKQGLLGSFDIIVSYNVIHTTQSIMESVLNLKSCLGDDGTLFIIESAKNETWATLAWGILDGWWYFKDYDLRPAEPMMEPEKWEGVLESAGFQSVITCPSQHYERKHVEKFLFLCSAKPISDSEKSLELFSSLGWWETDMDRFCPVKKLDELEDEFSSDDNRNTSQLNVREGAQVVYEELKKIWSEILGEEKIHPEDDFNSLGGESLLAIQMMNLVKKRIGLQLEIADTFGYPTLGALAGFITDELYKDCKEDVTARWNQTNKDESDRAKETDDSLTVGFRPVSSPPSEKGKGTLLMFPGQGSQKIGMCVSLKDNKEAREVFQMVEEVLGYNILDICLGDEVTLKQSLKSTEFVQVALFVGCLAKIEQMKADSPEILAKVTHVAGLSVGEFAALVYAEVISFHDALNIVSKRGKAMENIVKETPTGMVSVFGPKCKQLETFIQKYYPAMIISTYLADNQHTVGGKDQECDALVESLSGDHQAKMDIIDVRKLRVAGAFHSPYMSHAAEKVNDLIMCTAFSKPTLPVVMNVNGDVTTEPLEMKKLLCHQLTSPVNWKQSVVTAYRLGVRSFIEVAPGRVLSSIVKNRIEECQGCHVEYIQV